MSAKSEYRKTLGTFATGVTIITTRHDHQNFGFTANSFTSVSLDPPLVLFCLQKDSTFLVAVKKSGAFGINILSRKQEELSNKFANPALMNEQRFEGITYTLSELNCPIIKGSIGYLDCEKVKHTKTGDHHIILGHVRHFSRHGKTGPLVYYGGGYRNLIRE